MDVVAKRGEHAPQSAPPKIIIACDPFADVPLTECSMTLCGQRDSVTTQVVTMRWRSPQADLPVWPQ